MKTPEGAPSLEGVEGKFNWREYASPLLLEEVEGEENKTANRLDALQELLDEQGFDVIEVAERQGKKPLTVFINEGKERGLLTPKEAHIDRIVSRPLSWEGESAG